MSASDGIIRGHIQVVDNGTDTSTENGMPTKGFVRKKVHTKALNNPDFNTMKGSAKLQGAEAIIIKSSHKASGSGKQPTVIPLTKEQIDAVLRSLKVPVPVSKDNVVDATTQSSPVEEVVVETGNLLQAVDMKEINEKTPVVTINTSEFCGSKRSASPNETIPLEKRVKLEFSSPVSFPAETSSGLSEILLSRFKRKTSDAKPSPQRALHLTPEFVNPSPKMTMAPSGDAPKQLSPVFSQMENLDSSKAKKIEIIINESSSTGQPTMLKTLTISNPATKPQSNTVQLSNTSNIVHLPVITLPGPSQSKIAQPVHLPVQYVQDSKGQILQITGNSGLSPINPGQGQFITCTLPTTQNGVNVTNVHLVKSQAVKNTQPATTLYRPVPTKATLSPNLSSQIVPPQQPKSSTTTLLNKTPGGFIPVANCLSSRAKITITSPNSCVEDVFVAQNVSDIGTLS